MAASTKAQLGARVAPEIKAACVAAAKAAGESLNVWVERTLAAALAGGERVEPERMSAVARPLPAPRRAPAIRTGSEVAAQMTRESVAECKGRVAREREQAERQARLNAARDQARKSGRS